MTHGIGVVGVGVWGCHSLEQTLVRTGDARVVAVSTEDRWGAHNYETPPRQRGREYAEQLGAAFCEDWRDVVTHPDVSIISAMVCPREKAQVLRAALEAGKHVVTDKPLAFTVDQARDIAKAERTSTARGFMLAGYHPRPLLGRLVTEVADGRLGEVKAVSVRLCFMGGVYPAFQPSVRWRSEIPSGELTTIGSHAFVTLFRLIDEPVRSVYAVLRNQFYESYREAGAEDWAEVNLRLGSGAVANILVTRLPYRIPDEDILLEVTGTRGYAQVARNRLTFWPESEVVELSMDGASALQETFRSFYAAIESGGPMPTSFEDGYRLQVVLDAAIRSAAAEQAVGVDDPFDLNQ